VLIALFGSMPTACSNGEPVERGEQLVIDRARLDVPQTANNAGNAMAAFPDLALLPLNGVTPPSGKLIASAAVKTTMVLSITSATS
jgi:hypothetical protein